VKGIADKIQTRHFFIGHFQLGRVGSWIGFGDDLQPGFGAP
jgi:hypothetical protein